jgi:hypothetical protein
MDHNALCERAAQWLRNTRRCRLVLREVVSGCCEIPDAIGWNGGGWSTLIECKTSLADFRRDADKAHARADLGMGMHRFYMTEPDVIPLVEIPEGWGLLHVGRVVRVVRDAERRELSPQQSRMELIHMMRGIRMHNGEDTIPVKRSEVTVSAEGEAVEDGRDGGGCEMFSRGKPDGECEGDGHYECKECVLYKVRHSLTPQRVGG